MKTSVFKSYFDASETTLIGQYGLSAHAGHGGNIGSPREAFVRSFLEKNVGKSVTVGQGEIIDAFSTKTQQRKQQDVVLYDSSLPRLDIGGDISSFLREGVFATVEVKSTLTKEALFEACDAGFALRHPEGSFSDAYRQSWPRRFLVAYAGPVKMDTVFGWLEQYYRWRHTPGPQFTFIEEGWSPGDEFPMRHITRSNTLDGIFLLGVGFVLFEGFHFSLANPEPEQTGRVNVVRHGWTICDTERGALHALFVAMTDAIYDAPTTVVDYARELKLLPRKTVVMNSRVRI
ncbi:DUF6602 domain-containing protein [Luteibacter sp. 9135]|uniref:DUF6602 domain-containing protein n=1 Tax=Luteibacter sp. 9135 TaxID=1500893 RepID=UPI00056D71B7|nr:DUF6602 domain-containing protein [Luteibacter sp. 9135]